MLVVHGPVLTHLPNALTDTMPSLRPPCAGSSLARPFLLDQPDPIERQSFLAGLVRFLSSVTSFSDAGNIPMGASTTPRVVALRTMPELNDWPRA